jgi:hypothetical protein
MLEEAQLCESRSWSERYYKPTQERHYYYYVYVNPEWSLPLSIQDVLS